MTSNALSELSARPAPFEGLRVVDLSNRLSGAFAARLFGDFGADVILVEPPEGHGLRHEPPFLDDVAGPERSALHSYLHWNKRSVVAERPAGVGRFVAGADLVVTDADPPGAGRFAEALAELQPDAVHLSITPHGLMSPLAGRPGNDLTASARSGWSSINGYCGEPPLQMPGHQAGYIGGLAGFVAAAAALLRRDGSEVPELVDVSELEAFALTVHPWGVAAVYDDAGFSHGPAGRRPRGEANPLYDAADGRMSMAVAYFHHWPEAMEVLGLPDLAARPDLLDDVGRASRDLSAATAGIATTLPGLECWAVFHALAGLRCPVGVLQEIDSLVADEQLAARRFMVETTICERVVRAPGSVARSAPPLWELSKPAPRLDEHGPALRVHLPPRRQQVERSRPEPQSAEAAARGPLSGVRVLSLGQAWSGTFGTELLALLGADVVQLASLDRHDTWRRVGTGVPKGLVDPNRVQHALNTQGLYNSVNLNKREITLDLGCDQGMALFWRLLARFDVLVDNFRPTVLPSWGITMEALQVVRPGMIWASISGYGGDGPYERYAAIGSTIEPMSGLSALHGYDGDRGMNTGGLYPDPVAGYCLAAAVMAAIHRRSRRGEAQRIDLSMMEAVAIVCGDAVVGYDATGRVPGPLGNHHLRIAPHNHYQARGDEWLALAVGDDDAWAAFVAHLGDGRLRDPRFATMSSRKAHEAALDEIVAEWCCGQDASAAEAALGAVGISAARVVPLYEIYSRPDPNLVATGFIAAVDHSEAGETWLPGRPWKFSAAPSTPVTAAPCIGQHSREVLAEELGIGPDDYDKLVVAGVTGTLDDVEAFA